MIDHVSFNVGDFTVAKSFYEAALAPLGYHVIADMSEHAVVGMGAQFPDLWLIGAPATQRVHVALMVAEHGLVDAFHAAALAAGGTDNGAPGIRAHYDPTYYAAYVLDPAGNNIEVVCHQG